MLHGMVHSSGMTLEEQLATGKADPAPLDLTRPDAPKINISRVSLAAAVRPATISPAPSKVSARLVAFMASWKM